MILFSYTETLTRNFVGFNSLVFLFELFFIHKKIRKGDNVLILEGKKAFELQENFKRNLHFI